jgi:hypothetical protein
MKLLFRVSLICFLSASSYSQDKIEENDCFSKSEVTKLVKDEINNMRKQVKFYLASDILIKAAGEKKIDYFLNERFFGAMRKIDTKNVNDTLNLEHLFSQEDIVYMKCQLKASNTVKDWKTILKNEYFKDNDSIKKILVKYKTLKDMYESGKMKKISSLRSSYYYYSIPLFNKKRNFAVIYREDYAHGAFLILKKEKKKWIHYATRLYWIE